MNTRIPWLGSRDWLMIPGPSEPYLEVLHEIVSPPVPHYGPHFVSMYDETVGLLKKIFGTRQSVIILSGPGTAGVELAVANIVEEGDKVAVPRTGYFSRLIEEIVRAYGGVPVGIPSELQREVVDPRDIEEVVKREDVKAIIAVYSDTSTGVKLDLREIGEIARKHDLLFAVDAVSAFGAMEIRADEWGVDVCVGYPSKALGAVHGATPVMISDRMWSVAEERKTPVRSGFLNLRAWRKAMEEWRGWHPYMTSLSVQAILALRRVAKIAIDEGLEVRYLRHRIPRDAVRRGVESMGLDLFVKDEERATDVVTTVRLPDDLPAAEVISELRSKFNIIISSMALTGDNGVRIGHMGVTASLHYVLPTIFSLACVLKDMGMKVDVNEALAASSRVFERYVGELTKCRSKSVG